MEFFLVNCIARIIILNNRKKNYGVLIFCISLQLLSCT